MDFHKVLNIQLSSVKTAIFPFGCMVRACLSLCMCIVHACEMFDYKENIAHHRRNKIQRKTIWCDQKRCYKSSYFSLKIPETEQIERQQEKPQTSGFMHPTSASDCRKLIEIWCCDEAAHTLTHTHILPSTKTHTPKNETKSHEENIDKVIFKSCMKTSNKNSSSE